MKKYLILSSLAVVTISILINSCKKESNLKTTQTSTMASTNPSNDGMVLTPAGPMSKSNVHLIEKGYHLKIMNGHVFKMQDKVEKQIEDLGEIHRGTATSNVIQQTANAKSFSTKIATPSNANWTTYALWQNTASPTSPITDFETTWVVPGTPQVTTDSQVIFIFNGISRTDQTDILQPVLQWGVSAAGGTTGWGIANWYVWDDGNGNHYAAHSYLMAVSSGTSITGIISNTGTEADGSFDYSSSFSGYSNSLAVIEGDTYYGTANGVAGSVVFPFMGPEPLASEVLEVYHYDSSGNIQYNPVQSADYPQQDYVAMTNIQLSVGGTPQSLSWTAYTGTPASFGEHTVIPSGSGGSEVDLYFQPYKRPTFYISTEGRPNVNEIFITPNMTPAAVTSIVYTTDLRTGAQTSSAGNPTGWNLSLTSGDTYSIYVNCYNSAGGHTSFTQYYTAP